MQSNSKIINNSKYHHTSFLYSCIQDILLKHENNLDNLVLIFPNKRPILFIKKYISELITKPCFSPKLYTIHDFFLSHQHTVIPNNLILINKLHSLYIKKTGSTERLEEFYPWGEMLLNDFDDIDKYLISAKDIFQNLKSIKEFSNEFDYLSDDQKDIISRFWHITQHADDSEIQKKFIEIWDVLADLYTDYNNALQIQNIAYEGMAIRKVISDLQSNTIAIPTDATYIFIGFNALNACEHKLLSLLQNRKQARFYWDYDVYFKNAKSEAGYFIHKNLTLYPNELDESYFNSFSNDKQITIIEAPNHVSQVKHCEPIITKQYNENSITNSAIVLADEQLLVPLLQSIPQHLKYNISLGYPIKQTTAYALIESIVNLHQNKKNTSFYFKDVQLLCSNPLLQKKYAESCKELLTRVSSQKIIYISQKSCKSIANIPFIFDAYEQPLEYLQSLKKCISDLSEGTTVSDIDASILYQIFKEIECLESLITKNEIHVETITFTNNLIKQAIQSNTVPILGEPLQGMQIMGILETRLLDFENLTILSLNENILPKKSAGSSFIPYSIRTGFGMPTIKEQNAMYAYYFYRLLQRAKNITLLYSNQSDDSSGSEKSRYLMQLIYESPFRSSIIRKQISYPLKPEKIQTIVCNKNEETLAYFSKIISGEKKLSPTSLYTFISCELQFYFKHILKLQAPEEIKELPDDRDFGNIFHKTMEAIYAPLQNTEVSKSTLLGILQNTKLIEKTLISVIHEVLYNSNQTEEQQVNPSDLHYKTSEKYIRNLLQHDIEQAPFSIVDLEKEIDFILPPSHSNIHIGGTIDRIDSKNNSISILDYKTGKNKHEIESIESLFTGDQKALNSAVFQILMYCYIQKQSNPTATIEPNLLFLRDLHISKNTQIFNKFSHSFISNYAEIQQEFEPFFLDSINSLLNTSIPFTQTSKKGVCDYCDFKGYCKK